MSKTKKPVSVLLKNYIMYIVLVLLVVAFAIGTKGNFLFLILSDFIFLSLN